MIVTTDAAHIATTVLFLYYWFIVENQTIFWSNCFYGSCNKKNKDEPQVSFKNGVLSIIVLILSLISIASGCTSIVVRVLGIKIHGYDVEKVGYLLHTFVTICNAIFMGFNADKGDGRQPSTKVFEEIKGEIMPKLSQELRERLTSALPKDFDHKDIDLILGIFNGVTTQPVDNGKKPETPVTKPEEKKNQ